ncbi:MAG: putative LPLAT superfamily acyltransferase [Planctomycetota bacterium]
MTEKVASASELGSSQALVKPKWEGKRRGGHLGNAFFVLISSSRIGRFVTPFFLFWVVIYFLFFAPNGRRVSFDLARRVGCGDRPLGRLRFSYRHFYVYGAMLVERMAMLSEGDTPFTIEKEGEELIREGLEAGKGALLLTSHLGNWEAMAQCLSCIDAPVTLVMYDGVQPQVKKALEELSARRSFEVLYTDGGPASAAGILAALGRGSIVGVMADRTFAGRGVDQHFLGGEALFPVGPYSLAAASSAPVFQVFAIRTSPFSYKFSAFAFGQLRYTNRRRKNEDFERWSGEFATRLEEFTRRHPEQWGNLYDFWKEPYSA